MAIVQRNTDKISRFGVIDVDIVVTETENLNNIVTDKTIEDGSHIADNNVILPTTLTVTGFVLPGEDITADERFQAIIDLRLTREPFDVLTSRGVFENMVFDGRITVNRSQRNTNAISFTANLKEFIFVTSSSRFIPTTATKNPNRKVGGDDRQRGETTERGRVDSKETRETSAIVGALGL